MSATRMSVEANYSPKPSDEGPGWPTPFGIVKLQTKNLAEPSLASNLQNCELTRGCSFKDLSLW